MGRRRARRFFSALIALSALLLVTSCAVIPLFEIDIIEIVDSPLGTFGGATVTFRATLDNGDSYLWDFGDGSTGSGQLVLHTYSSEGTFTVRLDIATGARTLVGTKNIVIRLGGASGATALGQVVFGCQGFQGIELCGGEFGGSGFELILDDPDVNTSPNFRNPKMNANGQIIFECTNSNSAPSICGVNFDGSGFHIIAEDPNGSIPRPNFSNYELNDVGQIVFECEASDDTDDICLAIFGVTGYTTIVDDTTPGVTSPNYIHPDINNLGHVALGCIQNNTADICAVNSDGSGFRTVLDDPTGPGTAPIYSEPSINNRDELVVSDSTTGEITTVNFDGSGISVVFSAGFPISRGALLNDNGQVVFVCEFQSDGGDDICGVNLDGSGFSVMADDTNGGSHPEFDQPRMNNAGEILFNCSDASVNLSICAANFGVLGFTTLFDVTTSSYVQFIDSDIN